MSTEITTLEKTGSTDVNLSIIEYYGGIII